MKEINTLTYQQLIDLHLESIKEVNAVRVNKTFSLPGLVMDFKLTGVTDGIMMGSRDLCYYLACLFPSINSIKVYEESTGEIEMELELNPDKNINYKWLKILANPTTITYSHDNRHVKLKFDTMEDFTKLMNTKTYIPINIFTMGYKQIYDMKAESGLEFMEDIENNNTILVINSISAQYANLVPLINKAFPDKTIGDKIRIEYDTKDLNKTFLVIDGEYVQLNLIESAKILLSYTLTLRDTIFDLIEMELDMLRYLEEPEYYSNPDAPLKAGIKDYTSMLEELNNKN